MSKSVYLALDINLYKPYLSKTAVSSSLNSLGISKSLLPLVSEGGWSSFWYARGMRPDNWKKVLQRKKFFISLTLWMETKHQAQKVSPLLSSRSVEVWREETIFFFITSMPEVRLKKVSFVTFIALIPKKTGTFELKDFGPICFLGSVYKILTKVLKTGWNEC